MLILMMMTVISEPRCGDQCGDKGGEDGGHVRLHLRDPRRVDALQHQLANAGD